MRVLVVTAHLPPNLVSGGSLLPLRQAHALRARDHEVEILSGWVGPGRPTGSVWTDVVEGVPVHWVCTTAWTRWGARRNWENPQVAQLVRPVLERFAPDIVHAHSLQGLGADLLAPCAEAAAVVLTMHDFWWVCGRQFLVDRDGRPCAPVVAAGACQCQSGRATLDQRASNLLHRLEAVSRVVVASPTFARALESNGMDPGRIEVVEPSRDAAGPSAARDSGTGPGRGPLRLVFAGGPDPMKGWHVLRRAVSGLPTDADWCLTAYGVSTDHRLTGPVARRIRLLPAFPPAERDAVLAQHDVLVLPSVAAESYSLLAREALDVGLVVVATDAPGPLDVVDHGRNGLVVPRGDAIALRQALQRLLREEGLVEMLRGGHRPLGRRTADDEARDLERVYLRARSEATSAPAAAVRTVLFIVGIDGAPMRYRAQLPAEALRMLGVRTAVRHYRDPALTALAREADAIVLYRVPATRQVLTLVDEVRSRRDPAVPVLFDVDDLIVDPEVAEPAGLATLPEPERQLWRQGVRRYRMVLDASDAYVGSTDALCARVAHLTGLPSYRFANGFGRLAGAVADRSRAAPRRAGPPRLAYFSGTPTHDADWASIEPAVLRVMRRHPEVELWLGGQVRPTAALDEVSARVRRLPTVRWDVLLRLLRDIDVNLAPLAGLSPFNEAKSAVKWLEAALVGTPTVCTPTAAFEEVADSGRTAVLASTADDWEREISRLISDHGRRAALGEAARQFAVVRLGPWLQGRRYLAILEETWALVNDAGVGSRPAPATRWPADVLDEPPQRVVLEPYVAGHAAAWSGRGRALATAAHRAADAARRAASILRREGPRGILRRLR